MHIRSTDMEVMMGSKKAPGDLNRRYWFIDMVPAHETVFLLTDSPEIQQHTIGLYPDKVIVYEAIPNRTNQRPLNSWYGQAREDILNSTLPPDHRFTSLQHTLIDVLIAAHAKEFRGAPYSSLSELVAMYKSIGRSKFGWCSDYSRR